MPGPSLHALTWSEEQQQYELTAGGQPEHCFWRGDEPAWQSWLDKHSAFAFVGQSGRLSVLKEARSPHEELASSVNTAETRREEPRSNASYQDEQRVVLLSPKLSRPRRSTPLVERERLLSELDAVRSHPLTLVSASAGSGKTTLLSTWAALSSQLRESLKTMGDAERKGAEPVVAWLSLDELDNDPIRFWSSVIAALRTCLPNRGACPRQSAPGACHTH